MSSQRTPLEDLQLQGDTSNIARARRRSKREAEREITDDTHAEIAKLDGLISDAIEDCRLGPTVGTANKANPSFQNLRHLITCREMLKKGCAPPKKSSNELLADVDKMLEGVN